MHLRVANFETSINPCFGFALVKEEPKINYKYTTNSNFNITIINIIIDGIIVYSKQIIE